MTIVGVSQRTIPFRFGLKFLILRLKEERREKEAERMTAHSIALECAVQFAMY